MNADKLKGYLKEHKKTYKDCSEILQISKTSFNSKMNGKTNFNIEEINKLVVYLNMDYTTAMKIFFDKNFH